MKLIHHSIAALTLTLYVANFAAAGDECCHHCGCLDGCEKVCRLVREDKKVTITCWGCKCEDFCAPGKSHRGCQHCEEVCQDCDPDVCSESKDFVWHDWEPGCAKHIYTKKKLMKRTITKTVPSFKWVVEDLCNDCQSNCPCALVPSGTAIPPPPIPNARLISGISMEKLISETEPNSTNAPPPSSLLRTLFGDK